VSPLTQRNVLALAVPALLSRTLFAVSSLRAVNEGSLACREGRQDLAFLKVHFYYGRMTAVSAMASPTPTRQDPPVEGPIPAELAGRCCALARVQEARVKMT